MMIRKLVNVRIALTLGLAMTVLACTDDEDQDGASEAEGTDETHGHDSDESGDSDPGDGDGDPGDGDGDSGDGDGDQVAEALCHDGCELIANCYFEVPDCVALCLESFAEAGECYDSRVEASHCIAALSCEDYESVLLEVPGAPCSDEVAISEQCEGE